MCEDEGAQRSLNTPENPARGLLYSHRRPAARRRSVKEEEEEASDPRPSWCQRRDGEISTDAAAKLQTSQSVLSICARAENEKIFFSPLFRKDQRELIAADNNWTFFSLFHFQTP